MTDLEIAHSTPLLPFATWPPKLASTKRTWNSTANTSPKCPYASSTKRKRTIAASSSSPRSRPPAPALGKTTVSIGLALGLNRIGRKTVVALREPSLGPCFGMKGGAAGGGHAQVLPMEKINLHFTGDFHAITAAHNMIAALLDNYLYQHRAEGFGLKEVLWRRVLDVNDRSLRSIVTGLGPSVNGIPTQAGFDITPASELMAILCLAADEATCAAALRTFSSAIATTARPSQ